MDEQMAIVIIMLFFVCIEVRTDTSDPGFMETGQEAEISYLIEVNKTYFHMDNYTTIVSQEGTTTLLHCPVSGLGEGTISWLRVNDYHLITVGWLTYSRDDRFQPLPTIVPNSTVMDWVLQIKYPQKHDAGLYECQASSHPPTSLYVNLTIVSAIAEIIGTPDKFIKTGSILKLTCSLHYNTRQPKYTFWYHNDRMISYDYHRGITVQNKLHSSTLTIPRAQTTDSGNYTCVPSNTKPSSINVHVLNGEKPAAMYDSSRSSSQLYFSSYWICYASCLFYSYNSLSSVKQTIF